MSLCWQVASNYPSQRVFVRTDSTVQQSDELKGKLVGVTQYGSAGDTFFRSALKKVGLRDTDVTILQMGGTPGVSQALEAAQDRSLRPRGLGHDAGLSRNRAAVERVRARESLGSKALDGPLSTTERKIKADRNAVLRLSRPMSKRFITSKPIRPGRSASYKKYMRGLERRGSRHVVGRISRVAEIRCPIRMKKRLRAELEQIDAPKSHRPEHYLNISFLDELKEKWFCRQTV